MKLGYSIVAALGLATAAFFADAPRAALADDDGPSTKFKVDATLAAGKVTITITPTANDVFVNSEYPLHMTLAGKDGGSVSKSDLTKDDGTYTASSHEGKATKVTFTVDAAKGVTGDGKLVMCDLSQCGNPTKFHLESH